MCEGKEDILAVHTVRHASMSGNAVAKVLDIECSLETRCEETSERSDKRSEEGQKDEMELIWSIRNGREGSSRLEVGVRS